jgi:hypothetical protein
VHLQGKTQRRRAGCPRRGTRSVLKEVASRHSGRCCKSTPKHSGYPLVFPGEPTRYVCARRCPILLKSVFVVLDWQPPKT